MLDINVETPAAPVIPVGTPSQLGPSIREGTIAVTKAFGPKVGRHVPAAELAVQEQSKLLDAAQNGGPAPVTLLPSVRESTIAATELHGPKAANHVPPSELPASQTLLPQVDRPTRYPEGPFETATASTATPAAKATSTEPAVAERPTLAAETHAVMGDSQAAAEPAAPEVMNAPAPEGLPCDAEGVLPSIRESTIAMTERDGPKSGHHIPASELPAELTAIPEVERPIPQIRHESAASRVVSTVSTVVGSLGEAPATEVPVPAVPELIMRDAEGRLPSIRESTIAMTEKYGPKQPNHVPPGGLNKPAVATPVPAVVAVKASEQLVKAAPTPSASVKSEYRPPAVTIHAVKSVQRVSSRSLLAKPIREWGTQDVKQAASQVLENRVVMSALAVGAAALTAFSIYKGVEMYNRHRLCQSIAEVERERPAVVHLYIHRRSPLAPSVSIPCTRIETLLRLARVPYEAHVISDPSVSPDGELPFVVFSGLRIAGAQAITDALARELGASLDRDLSPENQATGVALLSVVRYSLTRGYMRSVHVDHPDVMQPYYSEMNRTPDWVTRFALRRMQKRLTSVNEMSGYSQLSSEQYVHELLRDVCAIEALLEQHTYLFSDHYPCSYDCALYAWLLPVVAIEDAAEVNEAFAYIVESELLTNYVRRMTELAFPDLDELVYGQLEERAEEEGEQQSFMSEEERTSTSRERSKSLTSLSARRPRTRKSESLRRAAEAGTAEEDGGAGAQTPLSQREMSISVEQRL
ncbi:hypothetical protein ABL78_1690 [Leptomonas seymouri]|uniref:Thioredoxin-like fold domain-containing protein n=1 Tax=Leptomonas seymouri TaxID=5684 RepID=A0A0N0P877_LEPSE|nr:hypothetical protein ABL78_1690 [Leptomonas seymouri]|eukprot:KPI89197.1 hypothetical protein ABL78_1690 [Leptomonas seymouri]